MAKYIPLIVTVVGTLAAALALPAYVSAHPLIYGVLLAVAQILHAALPSIFGSTK